MSKRKKNSAALNAQKRQRALWSHIWQIGCVGERAYLAWCAENGFAATTDKSEVALRQELKLYRARKASACLRSSRIDRHPSAVIEAVCADELKPEHIHSSRLRDACVCLAGSKRGTEERRALSSFVTTLLKATTLPLEFERTGRGEQSYMIAIVAIHRLRERFVRPVSTWRPTSRSRRRQFASLVAHLFSRYPIPAFFDDIWFRRDGRAKRYQKWCVDVAQGASLRDGPLPVPMTRKALHSMAQAPAEFGVEQAIRYGQVRALGGSIELCRAVLETRLAKRFAHDAFWQSVMRFFIAQPDLKLSDVGPIVDYLQHHKFDEQEQILDDGTARHLPPPQPNLSMHRRTLPALLAQVEQWHRRLGKVQAYEGMHWPASGIKAMRFVRGKEDKRIIWSFDELLSHKQLVREGNAQRHCVATYARLCRDRFSSIWSLTSEDACGNVRRRQTIQVTRDRHIVQCRGRGNKLPSAAEANIVRRWAAAQSLVISVRDL